MLYPRALPRLLLLFVCLNCAWLQAENRDAHSENQGALEKILDLGTSDNRVMQTLDVVVNRFGARLTASHADQMACKWVKSELEAYGLTNVRMEEAGEFPVGFERGPWSGKMLEPKEMTLEFGTPAWSAGTKGTVVADARLAPTDVDAAEAKDYEGRWVVMPPRGGRRNAEAAELRRRQTNFLREAKIAGFIYPTRNEYIITGGSPRISWDKLPTIPRINLRKDHWDQVHGLLEKGESVRLQFDIRNHFTQGPAKYYNVIGDIVGSEFPDEYVVLGGHIDSWDGATGTTDNGIGVAVNMEVARMLAAAGVKPRRTIRFMFWSGEEQGLLGSRAYIEQHPEELDKISGVFVWDGGTNALAGVDSSEAMYEDMKKAFGPVIGLNDDYPFEIKKSKGLSRGIGSDHDAFLAKNIPGFFWTQKGRADYRRGMHNQYDTYDLAIPEYLEHSVTAITIGALGVANLDNLLSRDNLIAPRAPQGRRMGVFLDEVTVSEVIPGSVAEKAGIQAGDIFKAVDGAAVTSRRELVRAIVGGNPKKKVVISRDGKEMEIEMSWPNEKRRAKL